MSKIAGFIFISCLFLNANANAQQAKTDLYNLVNKFLFDSTGYENVGDWGIGKPAKFPVKWKADRIEMSEDTSINFFRTGTADLIVNNHTNKQSGLPIKWSVMVRGPRMGYTSFSIISSPSADMQPKPTLDSIFGKKPYKATLLKSCDLKAISGYYYYEVKFPKKDAAFLKLSWLSFNGTTACRLDCYDSFSWYAVKLDCK